MRPIITLTTIPSRLQTIHEYGLKYCIESLMNQNCDDYEIHFNIPLVNRLTNEEYDIPQWLQEQVGDKLKIFRIQEDIGPLTKLIPTLERISDPEQIIIVLDDDLVYHPDMINEHVKYQTQLTDAVVLYDGRSLVPTKWGDLRDSWILTVSEISRVKELQHYKSCSYFVRYFEQDFFTDFLGKTLSDDVLMSYYFKHKKIKIFICFS